MSETTREGLDEAEAGDATGAAAVKQEEATRPADAEAAEQEQTDGPEGRGLAR